MKTLIVIPARYGSTRLPGKPLAMIAGQTLLQRVVAIARAAAGADPDIRLVVATDDERIGAHAESLGAAWVMTSPDCPTGTDRALEAVQKTDFPADFVINLQGDAPLTPPDFVTALIRSYQTRPTDIVTPAVQLTWDELDRLRAQKKETPFSGTTAVFDAETGKAHWFSKNILPAIRKESALRETATLSPVWRHIGLYGYSRKMLDLFVGLPKGRFEEMEGLEQLRALEQGYQITCVPVDYKGRANASGVDSPQDIARTEALIARHGELVKG